ncbi:Clavaminate synthase-like protein [Lophiostoma macrostomum CBS 122681]|uniref:Clavaminate synthase-like protein n=1 Tax=Lophiostoma macrostomum CBS 122681 TaxID=1314788 RepID=A0A6A6TDY0_9PLEO|nr:Clavaminate synthase-like protein [Lophiostoma macrostomum CBS 122681]
MSSDASFTIKPIAKSVGDRTNFGSVIEGLDLDCISDGNVIALADAIWTHKVVVVKGQKDLAPLKQWDLVTRFDPDAPKVHSHGDVKTFAEKGGVLSASREVVGIPGAENVRLIGKGYQGDDHYGIKGMDIQKRLLNDFHLHKLPEKDFKAGITRFQRWHIDAPLYAREPAWFTTLRYIKRPTKPEITIRWDDGSGYSMKTEPGLTAFISNVQTYELMTPDERATADHSWVEYAPHPFMWIANCSGRPNGLGLEPEGKEKSLEELGDYDPKDIKRYPMVWVNPVTGERSFQVHGICARRLFLRSSLTEEPRVIDDVDEIRAFLKPIQERVLKPEYVILPKTEEGDILMWANYQVFHTAVDYPIEYGPRTMHQTNIGASIGPAEMGLFRVPVSAA